MTLRLHSQWRRFLPGLVWLGALSLVLIYIGLIMNRRSSSPKGTPSPLPQQTNLSSHFFRDPACRSAYENLFRRDQLDVRVVFGYKDARPARFVGDRYEKIVFAQALLKSCASSTSQGTCGFQASASDSELFLKSIPGPDGRPRQVHLHLVHSSAGPDDEENRRNPYQAWLSRRAHRIFTEGLKEADIVLYDGHSRDGGGPDFDPPRLRKDSHTDYSWYRGNQPGLTEMLALLPTNDSSGPWVLGMFSCASSKHFTKAVQEAKPGIGVVASRKLIYYADALESSLDTLSALLEMKCQPDFDQAIRAGSNQAGAFLTGFFN